MIWDLSIWDWEMIWAFETRKYIFQLFCKLSPTSLKNQERKISRPFFIPWFLNLILREKEKKNDECFSPSIDVVSKFSELSYIALLKFFSWNNVFEMSVFKKKKKCLNREKMWKEYSYNANNLILFFFLE